MSRARIALAMTLSMAVLAAPPVAVAARQGPQQGAAMVEQVNAARAAHGLPALGISEELTGSATGYARWMLRADYFGHQATIRAGGSFLTLGEALAWHSGWRPRVSRTLSRWMSSPPHRALVLNPLFRYIGTAHWSGRFSGRRATMWVAQFGG
jgi:uncharacterized protein YkwD